MIREWKLRVSLHNGASISARWQSVILPWFRNASLLAWQKKEFTAVVVPSRSYAHSLRALLLEHNLPLLGVRFLTPTALREMLLNETGTKLALREHLCLLLAVAAEQESSVAAKSVLRAPDHLLRTIDQLSAAGWRFAEAGPPALRKVTAHFEKLVQRCDFQLIHDADRAAAEHAARASLFSDLLIAGFDGAHWPLWFLLRASVNASARATVVLNDPRDEARDLDETWIGTWEEIFGASTPVGSSPHGNETLFPELFEPECPTPNARAGTLPARVHFLVGRTVTEQAKAVSALLKHFLGSESADRIGVLFPSAGALPRTVAALLSEAEIPHNDGIAHLEPGPLEDDAWRAWLELQENPRLRILLRFLRASPKAAQLFGGLPVYRVERILRGAYRDLLMDDLDLLREYCAHHSDLENAGKVAQGLASIRFLPETATLSDYLAQTCKIFADFNWTERWTGVEQASLAWRDRVAGTFSRAIYLRWLAALNTSLLPARDPAGDHPYSRVQLLLYPQAEGQQWSHLIFTGLNEGLWPPRTDESGFLSDDEVGALNARIRKLNRSALRQGSQGEGHSVIAEGKTFCLGAMEHRQLAERQFRNLLESVTGPIGVSANLVEESAPERLANPSEFFTQLYYETRGEALSQSTMSALQTKTRTWLQKETAPPPEMKSADVEQTAIAYRARRQQEQAFGEYEFALREPLAREVTLSATDWEKAIKTPALVWMKRFLGVEAEEDEFVGWTLAIGQWAHRWLRQIALPNTTDSFAALPDADTIRTRVRKAALRFRAEVSDLVEQVDRGIPEWWTSGWKQASYIADRLADRVAKMEGHSHFTTEWTLPGRLLPLVRGDRTSAVSISGRIDLLLARGLQTEGELPYSDLWVIDYKTGNRKTLAPSKFVKGEGLQLALYALVLRAVGATQVGVSVLTRDLDLDGPQLGIDVIEEEENVWRALAHMARSGVFGMRGELHSDFGFQNDYPLATLPIDRDVLEEKWALTYPDLALPDEE